MPRERNEPAEPGAERDYLVVTSQPVSLRALSDTTSSLQATYAANAAKACVAERTVAQLPPKLPLAARGSGSAATVERRCEYSNSRGDTRH